LRQTIIESASFIFEMRGDEMLEKINFKESGAATQQGMSVVRSSITCGTSRAIGRGYHRDRPHACLTRRFMEKVARSRSELTKITVTRNGKRYYSDD
jgi:hypothetical protein